MPRFEFFEEFPYGPELSCLRVFQTLANSFVRIYARSHVQKTLIRLGVLHNSGSFAFYREHHRASTFLELPQEIAGPAAKCSERLNVLGNIKHRQASTHLFRC